MDKLEKVLKGLQCCNTWSCAGLYEGYQPDYDACIECPFRCDPIDPEECHKKLLDSALSLLKEQEPRVMTLEEAKQAEVGTVVWLEWRIESKINPALFFRLINKGIDDSLEFHVLDGFVAARLACYGTEWRCWTSRPTDEQRKATPWTS